jgi:hypothetical protein
MSSAVSVSNLKKTYDYGFLGISDIPLWICFSVLFIFIALFSGITIVLFKRGMGVKN